MRVAWGPAVAVGGHANDGFADQKAYGRDGGRAGEMGERGAQGAAEPAALACSLWSQLGSPVALGVADQQAPVGRAGKMGSGAQGATEPGACSL